MAAWLPAAASAFWLGLMTSISPCPLAANIAAMSYVGREVGSSRRTVLALGIIYGLALFALSEEVLLPSTSSPLLGIPWEIFGLAHISYGVVMGWLVGRQKR